MSIIGEMWEESDWERDKKLKEFLDKLKALYGKGPEDGGHAIDTVIEMYKEHFNLKD